MLLKCERCGAPLEVPAGTSVRCQYCGTTAGAPAPAPPAAPTDYGYGQGHGRYPVRVQPPVQPHRSPMWIGLVTAGSVVVASLAATVLPQLMTGNTSTIKQAFNDGGAGSVTLSQIGWATSPPGCFIDANGDGVSDMAGLTGPSENNQATVVDGKTGAVLFTAPAVVKAAQFGCLGPNAFFLAQGNFQIDFFTARSPWGKTQVMARDKISEYGTGIGCVQLKTDDGTVQGIQLPSGVASTCTAPVMRRYYQDEPGLMGLTDHGTELVAGTRKYTMTQRASGTEILSIRVSEGTKELWKKETPYASCTFGAGIAVAPGKIMLWAAHPADRDKGLIIGLDETTGNQLYELPVPDSSTDNPQFFKYNGKYVVAVSWGALRAYDPATGSEVWRVGR